MSDAGYNITTRKPADGTGWIEWTPTGSWTSNTEYSGIYRVIDDTLEMFVAISIKGGVTDALLYVDLPPGFKPQDAARPPTMFGSTDPCGYGALRDASPLNHRSIRVILSGSFESQFVYLAQAAIMSRTSPITWANGDSIEFYCSLAIERV